MLTLDKLKVYGKYGGDIDRWAIISHNDSNKMLTDKEWALIDSLLQDIVLSRNGFLSPEYLIDLNNRLSNTIENNAGIEYLKSLAK